MVGKYEIVEIAKAFLYGNIAYLAGGIVSLQFELLRENTVLYPRVPLIAAGLGGILLGLLLNGGEREGILKFLIVSITSYLAVIFINLISLSSALGQEFSLSLILSRILLPAIVYGMVFGIQVC